MFNWLKDLFSLTLNEDTPIKKQRDTTKLTQEQKSIVVQTFESYKSTNPLKFKSVADVVSYLNRCFGVNKSRQVYSKIAANFYKE